MRVLQAGVAAVVIACSASLLAQAGPRRDGKWDVTVQMSMAMPDMPQGMNMPPQTMQQCITKEEANDPNKAIPTQPQGRRGGPPPDCKVTDQKVTGNTITAKMVCTGEMAGTGTMEMTYGADTYTGKMIMNTQARGMNMTMTMNYSGKRVGDCVK